jgi:hypothetical protein
MPQRKIFVKVGYLRINTGNVLTRTKISSWIKKRVGKTHLRFEIE